MGGRKDLGSPATALVALAFLCMALGVAGDTGFMVFPAIIFVIACGCIAATPFLFKSRVDTFLALPLFFAAAYGLFVSVFPSFFASYLIPARWEWPVGERTAPALLLGGGKKAVALGYTPRVQIYDRDGKYLTGWFVAEMGRSYALLGAGLENGDFPADATVLVRRKSGREVVLYSLDGEAVWKRYDDGNRAGTPNPVAPVSNYYEAMAFPLPWYVWTLTSPYRFLLLLASLPLGVAGAWMRRRFGSSQDANEDETPSPIITRPRRLPRRLRKAEKERRRKQREKGERTRE